MTIGKKLRGWRESLGVTQTQAARAAGISQAQWAAVEMGDFKRIGLGVAQRIVAVTDGAVTLDDFPKPRGRKVRPIVSSADSSPQLVEDCSLHARESA